MYKTSSYMSSTKFSISKLCVLYFSRYWEKPHTCFEHSLTYSSIFDTIYYTPECFTYICLVHILQMQSVFFLCYRHKCIEMTESF